MLIVSDGLFLESYLVEQFKQSYDIRLLHVDDLKHVKSLSRHYDTVIYCPVASSSVPNISYVGSLCDAMTHDAPDDIILISSYEVYGREASQDKIVTESDKPQPDTAYGRDMFDCERQLIRWCDGRDTRLTILRAGEIVGNGMTGRIRHMTDKIANGMYIHLPGYDGTVPLIHAEDLAMAAACLGGKRAMLNINDGCTYRRKDVAEAIAHRLNDKRILTMPRRLVSIIKMLSTIVPSWRRLLAEMSADATFSIASARQLSEGSFKPRDVVKYLNSQY